MARKPAGKFRRTTAGSKRKTAARKRPAVARKRRKKVRPIPADYHSITPYLVVKGAADALAFYKKAFGAVEKLRMEEQDRIGHAEIVIGDSHVMLADEHPEIGAYAPRSSDKPPISMMLYVPDVDRVFARAVKAGATVERELADQFYGDRTGGIVDPFGHRWYISTHIEDVEPSEMERRMKQAAQTS